MSFHIHDFAHPSVQKMMKNKIYCIWSPSEKKHVYSGKGTFIIENGSRFETEFDNREQYIDFINFLKYVDASPTINEHYTFLVS